MRGLIVSLIVIQLTAGVCAAEDSKNPWLVSLSANYGSWRTGDLDSDGSQAMGFFQMSYDSGSWGAALTGAYVNTSYKASFSDDRFTIDTFTDTDISTYYSYKRKALTVQGGVDIGLPTGEPSYSDEDLSRIIVDDVSQDLMLINTYGAGLDIIPHIVLVYKFGRFTGGLGARYEFTGEYDPTKDTPDDNFDPGDRLLGVLNGVLTVSKKDYLLLTLSYSYYGKDKQGGEEVYRQGDTVSVDGRYIRQWDSALNTVLGVSYLTQAKNEILGDGGSLESERANSNNNSLEVYLNTIYRYSGKLSLTGLVGYKQVGANGYSEDDDYYDAGRSKAYVEPGIAWYFSSRMYATLKARYSSVKDKKDASSAKDASYDVLNVDAGVVYSF